MPGWGGKRRERRAWVIHRATSLANVAVGTLLAFGGLVPVAESAAAAGPAPSARPSFCGTSGAIAAADLSAPVDLSSCPIQGREIVDSINGRVAASVHVPPPGQQEGNAAVTPTGGSILVATTDPTGQLTVTQSDATASTSASSALDSACSEGAYNLESNSAGSHPFWAVTNDWRYNSSTEGPGITYALDNIRAGVNNMTNGINNCGYTENAWSASAAYQGDVTGVYANIDSAGNCTSSFPDGHNTVSWENFTDSTKLGETCWHAYYQAPGARYEMNETDIAFAKYAGIVSSFPSNCNNSYWDLQTVATHEWGHAFGLAHESSDGDEVMYPYITPCQNRRHLGKGDYNAMASLYG